MFGECVLKRIVQVTGSSWEHGAVQRYLGLIIPNLRLEQAKGVQTPEKISGNGKRKKLR